MSGADSAESAAPNRRRRNGPPPRKNAFKLAIAVPCNILAITVSYPCQIFVGMCQFTKIDQVLFLTTIQITIP